jgi:hypothetical protein
LILKLINVAMASGLRSRSIDLIRLTQPHGINACPTLSRRDECRETGGEKIRQADGVRQISAESGGLITTAALARHAHGTHTHLSVGIANKLE